MSLYYIYEKMYTMSINQNKDPKSFIMMVRLYIYIRQSIGLEAIEMFRFSSSFTIFFESI